MIVDMYPPETASMEHPWRWGGIDAPFMSLRPGLQSGETASSARFAAFAG
jgi:hypothetical protein